MINTNDLNVLFKVLDIQRDVSININIESLYVDLLNSFYKLVKDVDKFFDNY